MSGGILYLSYDGMLEPLGQSQVLAYLERLARDRPVDLLSFEKASDWQDRSKRQAVADRCAAAGIRWHPLRYHKRPSLLATAYDVAAGTAAALRIARRHRPAIVHARSYVPALIALSVKRMAGTRFVFDMRGFWANERVDGGLWPENGRLFKITKAVERRFLQSADHIVTLTHASIPALAHFDAFADRPMPPVTVIPTCADLDRFAIQGPLQRTPFVLGHIGAVGTWYLLDEMMRCFVELRRQRADAQLIIANRGEHGMIRERAAARGIAASALELTEIDHRDVPAFIGRMSAGMAIIKPAFSKTASAPTKLAEYLGCGVPCLGNAGVGDLEAILEERGVGVALPGFSDAEIEHSISRLIALTEEPSLADRCRTAALELFSLEEGVRSYDAIYRALAAQASRGG